jgi:type I restriction enzyme S subunit
VGRVGSYCGAVHFSSLACWVTDNAIKATAKDGNDPLFLFYLLKQINLNNWRSGSGQPLINQSTLNSIEVRVPLQSEQRRIGEFVAALDDRISLLCETNATLEAIAQALFKSWFVDFDPVRAKMEGRAPEGMDEATAALFPDSFEESELGLVPRGWDVSTVGRSFTLTMGQSPPGDTYNEIGEGLPFYQGRTDFGFRFPSQRVFCTAPTRLAEIGDTLVSVRAPVGDVNVALEPCALGRGVASVRSLNGYAGFTFYSIRSLKSYFELHDGEGTVFGSINKKDFESLPVIAPDNSVVYAFEGIVSVLDDSIKNNEQKLRALSDLRDTLLPRLISGQLHLG